MSSIRAAGSMRPRCIHGKEKRHGSRIESELFELVKNGFGRVVAKGEIGRKNRSPSPFSQEWKETKSGSVRSQFSRGFVSKRAPVSCFVGHTVVASPKIGK